MVRLAHDESPGPDGLFFFEGADELTMGEDRGMDAAALREFLEKVRVGEISADEAVDQLRRFPFTDMGYARIDHHRALRQGMAESVYGPGKSPEQCAAIVAELLGQNASSPVVLSRATDAQVAQALDVNPGGLVVENASAIEVSHSLGSLLHTVIWRPAPARNERLAVVTAGTADLPVADECAAVLAAHGFNPVRIADVGVAGLHRILDAVDELLSMDAIVVVAGMEGALASVIGGLVACPVVAIPTSVGYGSSLEGVTALLGMTASCASGLTVVGIDNGFGAAIAIVRMLSVQNRQSDLSFE